MPKVRDAIRLGEREGGFHARTNGSHRIYTHPDKPGRVVIAGRPSKDLPTGTWQSILKQAGLNSRG
ncbi:MAG: type II toxin-antitoxin system HicA family toxin [Chloroflexota bacterium]|nr:type II toxin-antitoxin system HicA family toxin [Chloroflexota bacterium]